MIKERLDLPLQHLAAFTVLFLLGALVGRDLG